LIGPLVGAAVWTFLRQGLQDVDVIAGIWKLILGLIFILLITFFRRGLVGGAVSLWQRVRAPR
jgi:branched-chain amino acid transport system permease protein